MSSSDVVGAVSPTDDISMAMDINELRADDYDALAELWRSIEDMGPVPFDSAAALSRFLHEHRGLSVAAREEDGIVAAVLCSLDGEGGCTNTLAVRPTHRNDDLARQVFDKALKKIAVQGIHRFRVCLAQEDDHSFWNSVKRSDQPDWTTRSGIASAVACEERATEPSTQGMTDDCPSEITEVSAPPDTKEGSPSRVNNERRNSRSPCPPDNQGTPDA